MPFSNSKEIDLLHLLPPPPANNSVQTANELNELHEIEKIRTPAMATQAAADTAENVWVFANVVGNPKFTKEQLPVFAKFFDRVTETEGAVVDPAKKVWARPRPPFLDTSIHAVVPVAKSGAYPSGHTTVGTLWVLCYQK